MTDLPAHEVVEVPENAVIVIHDRDNVFDHDWFEEFAKAFHERYPNSLVVVMSGDMTFETMTEDELQGLILDLQQHREGRWRREGR